MFIISADCELSEMYTKIEHYCLNLLFLIQYCFNELVQREYLNKVTLNILILLQIKKN